MIDLITIGCKNLDSQIIISREDNTDFLSIGFIQTDTSLVSALGGALANFAQEIGLAEDNAVDKKTDKTKDRINFSRFQNGVLASKIVPVKEHNPIVLIAIKGYDGLDKDLDFVVEYASELTSQIVTKFMAKSLGIFVPLMRELAEMMYQYDRDYVFNSSKFDNNFGFVPTPYNEGISNIINTDY